MYKIPVFIPDDVSRYYVWYRAATPARVLAVGPTALSRSEWVCCHGAAGKIVPIHTNYYWSKLAHPPWAGLPFSPVLCISTTFWYLVFTEFCGTEMELQSILIRSPKVMFKSCERSLLRFETWNVWAIIDVDPIYRVISFVLNATLSGDAPDKAQFAPCSHSVVNAVVLSLVKPLSTLCNQAEAIVEDQEESHCSSSREWIWCSWCWEKCALNQQQGDRPSALSNR